MEIIRWIYVTFVRTYARPLKNHLFEKVFLNIHQPDTLLLPAAKGRKTAIAEAEKLQMDGNHFYHLLLGHLYPGIDDQKATRHLQIALKLAKSSNEKSKIREDIIKLKNEFH